MRKKVAVIGSGVSGLGAVWALKDHAEVHLFEREDTHGGHAHTVTGPEGLAVDVGFIVYNRRTYPNLVRLFADLDVPTHKSDMSFAVQRPDGSTWSSANLIGSRRGLSPKRFRRLALDAIRFKFAARRSLKRGDADGSTLQEWLEAQAFSSVFRDDYLLPMTAAIWSTPLRATTAFPAEPFLRFMVNHALTDVIRPIWRTVTGGSKVYVQAILDAAKPVRRTAALTVKRLRSGAEIHDGKEATHFDAVVFAGHPDDTLAVFENPDPMERATLSAIRYADNRVVLHTDPGLMPRDRRLWASWSLLEDQNGRACVSYWMNRLQGLKTSEPVIVSLNPIRAPQADRVILERSFSHPLFDADALAAQKRMQAVQGRGGVYYAGAWLGHGFHEDGLASGLWAAERLGARLPWRPVYDRLAFHGSSARPEGDEDAMATA